MATVIDLPEHRPVDRRFVAMLGLSLALHAALLAWTHGPQQEMTPAQVLSATLRMVIPEAVQAPAPLAEPITSTPIPDVRRVRDMPPSRRHEAASSVAVPAEMPRPTTDGPPAQAPVAVVAEALPPPKVVPNQANLLDAYGRLLAGLLSRHQEYPRLAAMRGWEGEVLIRLRVARKGNLLGVQVDRSSGFEILDRHALSILEQLPGLPPLPEGVEGNEIQVVVPVSYRLKKLPDHGWLDGLARILTEIDAVWFAAPGSLHTRISAVLTCLAASLLLVLAGFSVQGMRSSIHEEVEAATRVSVQWMRALADELDGQPSEVVTRRVLAVVRPLGRVRANALEVYGSDGQRLYASPPTTYKADQRAPDWFSALVTPPFTVHRIIVGDLELVVTPDPSRAVIDAWDDVQTLAAWAIALLAALFVVTRYALDRTLRPLEQVMAALDSTGRGRFDVRLPAFSVRELGRLSQAFNGMADRLVEAVDQNARLQSEREVGGLVQTRLEEERRAIARELHDELSQGITAVRALAGAIAQRTQEQPALLNPAQSIVAVTGEMQDGVKVILHRLRSSVSGGLGAVLERNLANWQAQHPEIALSSSVAIGDAYLDDEVAQAALRIVQEGLTNIVRHAGADHAELTVMRDNGWLVVTLTDNGRGLAGTTANPGSGLGVTGMQERIAALGGRLEFDTPTNGGLRLVARLPDTGAYSSPEQAS